VNESCTVTPGASDPGVSVGMPHTVCSHVCRCWEGGTMWDVMWTMLRGVRPM
jgi:hypothetical protein